VDDQDQDWLAQRFEEHRARLAAVAYRMLGSRGEADDAVQEAWLRLSRADSSAVHNLGGWLTTVVGRVCLDMLRSRAAHREEPLDGQQPELATSRVEEVDPEQEALMAESVGLALLVVLDTLAPAERLAFVLHDMFAISFDEIASILGRSPNATKQLASRARQRIQAAEATPGTDIARQTQLVKAFLAASRSGDFAALLAVLDPGVVLNPDATAIRSGALAGIRGAAAVAKQFAGRAQGTQPALVNGLPGAVWTTTRGTPRGALRFTMTRGKIVRIDIVMDPQQLRQLDLVILGS
jgi:RNA polymerase sigma factor (sigma-70 family)